MGIDASRGKRVTTAERRSEVVEVVTLQDFGEQEGPGLTGLSSFLALPENDFSVPYWMESPT
jgi:hypothetical protein